MDLVVARMPIFFVKLTGIERSVEMVDLAKTKKINGFNPIIGDITSFKLPDQFDVVVSLFHVISYLTKNESLIACFKSAYKQLKPNGIFVFDVWYSPAVYYLKPETRIKRLENEEIAIVRLAEPTIETSKNMVAVNYEVLIKDKTTNIVETFKEEHLMRHFSIPEIKMLAEFTGFEVVVSEEFLSEKLPSETTWGICFILKKR